MHICHEEIFAFLALLPGLAWLKMRWRAHRLRCREARTCGHIEVSSGEKL
jgi:hypothetical protein